MHVGDPAKQAREGVRHATGGRALRRREGRGRCWETEAATALAALIRDGFTGATAIPILRAGCVVSDEIHHINDVDRGAVWEETLMHMPASIQLAAALSATFKDPESF